MNNKRDCFVILLQICSGLSLSHSLLFIRHLFNAFFVRSFKYGSNTNDVCICAQVRSMMRMNDVCVCVCVLDYNVLPLSARNAFLQFITPSPTLSLLPKCITHVHLTDFNEILVCVDLSQFIWAHRLAISMVHGRRSNRHFTLFSTNK